MESSPSGGRVPRVVICVMNVSSRVATERLNVCGLDYVLFENRSHQAPVGDQVTW